MLANKHRVRVGEVDMVGYVTKNGEAQASVLTGVGANYFRNPLLPYTHSQMVLPFKIDERVTGALDIQNDKARAFDQDDIAIMQVMADQLAVAIEKTRLLQEVERNILEMERSYREHTASTWRAFAQQSGQQSGYRFEGITPEPIDAPPPGSREAMERGTSIIVRETSERGGSLLAVPIRLRGQAIGVLNLRFHGREVPGETSLLVEEVANRLALALENARLVQEAQRLARRERQVNLITSQIQQTTDLDTILQNTVRELGDALGVPRTFIQIGITPATDQDKEN
jgi:GAF domain-containing protein